jgi:putative zinc finger protein
MRNCIDEGILQAWFDGELVADEAARVAAHLNVCAACAASANEVEAESLTLREALSSEFAANVPSERLRERVDAALVALHQAKEPAKVRSSSWNVFTDFFRSFRPLAYASFAAVILVAGIIGLVYLKNQKNTSVAVKNNPLLQIHPQETQAPPPRQPDHDTIKPDSSQSPSFVVGHKRKSVAGPQPEEPDATSLVWQERQYESAIAKLGEALKYQPPMGPALQVEYEYNMAVVDSTIASTRDAARKNPKDPLANQSMLAAYQSKVDLMNEVAQARAFQK